jgi:hypothetical protein
MNSERFGVESKVICGSVDRVSASQIIEDIPQLSPIEQAEVIRFAYRLDAERMLSGKELGTLAKQMIEASNPAEKLKIREELTRGFYGGKPDA